MNDMSLSWEPFEKLKKKVKIAKQILSWLGKKDIHLSTQGPYMVESAGILHAPTKNKSEIECKKIYLDKKHLKIKMLSNDSRSGSLYQIHRWHSFDLPWKYLWQGAVQVSRDHSWTPSPLWSSVIIWLTPLPPVDLEILEWNLRLIFNIYTAIIKCKTL